MNQAADPRPPRANWLTTLAELNLPLLPGSREAVIHQLHRPGANADSVARAIRLDPVLCLRLLTRCNRLLIKNDTEVHQLTHIVSLLGFPALEQQIKAAPVLKAPNPGYLAAIGRSQFAAGLAAVLSGTGDSIYLAALLFNTPNWALWHRAPETMIELDRLTAEHSGGRSNAEMQLFGSSLNNLAAKLVNSWHLPAMTKRAWQFNQPHRARFLARLNRLSSTDLAQWQDSSEEAQRLLAMPALTLALVNNLAESSHWDWHSRQTGRWLRLLNRQRPTLSTEATVHRVAGQLELAPAIPAHCHPGRRLLGNWREAGWIKSLAPTRSDPVAENAPAPAFSNRVVLTANLRRLRGQRFANLHQLMNVALETLCDGAGFEHALIMMLNGRRDLLRSYYHRGFDRGEPLTGLRLPIPAQTRGIFSKLLEQSGGIHVTPTNLARMRGQLPRDFATACDADHFALISVFHQRLPVAIVYIDTPALSTLQYRLFKQICRTVAGAITNFAGRRSH